MECFVEFNVFGENGIFLFDFLGDVFWLEFFKKRGMVCCLGEVSYIEFC